MAPTWDCKDRLNWRKTPWAANARWMLITAAFVSTVFGGCSDREAKNGEPLQIESVDQRVFGLFGGKAGFAPLLAVTNVEAFRVERNKREQDTEDTIFGYPILAGPVGVEPEVAAMIVTALADPNAYGWDYAKSCEFDPGVALRFRDANSITEVLLCFTCDELMVVRAGKVVGAEDTEGIRGPLVAAAKQMFQDDKVIQSLLSPEEEQAALARHQRRERAIRQRQTRDMDAAVAAAIEKGRDEFSRALSLAHPDKDAQIRVLLAFEGGRNSSWTTSYGDETMVYEHLRSYSREELSQPVREALLGNDRQRRRGAARLWSTWRSPLADWKPSDFSELLSARLSVMQEWRRYEVRQQALALMEREQEHLDAAEFDRRLQAGLHDPEVSVRRQAILVAGRTGHHASATELMGRLQGQEARVIALPSVPPEEEEYVERGSDRFAGKRPESEVAALALGYLRHTPAKEIIEKRVDESPMYAVALALMGKGERLAPEHFDGSTGNRELQFAAIEAVVRLRGEYGLAHAVRYRQATHGTEPEQVLERLKTMFIENMAQQVDLLKKAQTLEQLADWFEEYGAGIQRQIHEGIQTETER